MNKKTKQFNLASFASKESTSTGKFVSRPMVATNNNIQKVASFSARRNVTIDRIHSERDSFNLKHGRRQRRTNNQIVSSEGLELGTPGQYRPRQDLIYEPSGDLGDKRRVNLLRCHSEMIRKLNSGVESKDGSRTSVAPSQLSKNYLDLSNSSTPDSQQDQGEPQSPKSDREVSAAAKSATTRIKNGTENTSPRNNRPSMLLDLVVNENPGKSGDGNYFETTRSTPAAARSPVTPTSERALFISSPTSPRKLSPDLPPWEFPTSSLDNVSRPRSAASTQKTFTLPPHTSPRDLERAQEGHSRFSFHRGILRRIGRKSSIENSNQVDPLDPYILNDRLGVEDAEENETEGKKKKDKKKKSKPPSRHGSDAKNSDKVRTKLKKFINRRPTMESLQERGIIQESVFGCPLDKLCEKEQTPVPKFIQKCVEEVEKRGLDVDGIYRVSGNLSHVQKLRYMVDRDEEVNLSDPQWEDIHLITGALKMFLRELPEPVIPFNFFDKFITACKIQDERQRISSMKSLVKVLPKPNGKTLKYLMKHFCRVVEHSSSNRMQVQNVAIVFGPTLLLKPPDESGGGGAAGHMHVYMVYQNQIIDYMLTEYDTIFGN